MDADHYQRIFLVVAEPESLFVPRSARFQYILTTTEPPPDSLQIEPWSRQPVISATEPAHKFLDEDS